ncbi:MAG: EAL domain-containing protein [Betaproteobacteria bacterium]|nr:EAL domain-containing protein [Betaproteobacteria bacterium]
MSTLPISARLLLSYLLVAVLPLAGLSAFYLTSFEASLRATLLANVSTIADKKVEQIGTFVSERLTDAQQLSQRGLVHEAVAAFGKAFREDGLNSPAYRAVELRLRQELKNHTDNAGYYDLLLMDTAGNVVFSIARETDLGTNLHTGPYRTTQLAQGFDLTVRTLQTRLTRFAPYAPSGNQPAAFLMAPILGKGVPVGVLALQVNLSRLESVTADRTGLGRTGETVLAQREGGDAYYTVPLRHKPDAAYRYRVPLQQAALPMQQALAGGHERGMIRDYAGIECVAAWRYLPALRWGMVVKIDAEEALAPATRLRRLTYLALALFLLLSGAAAYFLGRALSRPIRDLTRVADRIAGGDLSQRAPQTAQMGSDELGRLASAFNHMTDALADARSNLEARVETRTQELKAAEEFVKDSAARLNEAQHTAQVGSWELDLASGKLHWSDEIFNLFEIDQNLFGASYEAFLNAIHPEDRDQVNQTYASSLATREPYEIAHRLLMPDGRIKWVNERCRTFYDDQGKPLRSTGTVQDITARKQAETALQLYATAFERSGEAIIITDAENKILATNEAFYTLTGYTQEEVLGKNPRILASQETRKEVYQQMWQDLNAGDFWTGELWDRRKDGHVYPKWTSITAVRNEQNQVVNYIAHFTDITEHKAAADKISYLAHHDTLTGLPNRFTLVERLKQAINSSRRNKEKVAVMFIDLDRFKIINDTLGHHVGDQLLVEVAQRLQSCVRNSDIVARLGGDEFVVALPELEEVDMAFHVADKILKNLGLTYSLDGHNVHSSPSIGIAFFPEDGNTIEEVMKNADVAMYHAKTKGRNNYQFFEPSMNQSTLERLELEHDMRTALARGEFVLHYQPKINTATGRVSGVEALVRWQHPEKGLIPPATFIPLAEESGLILPLGEWVLHTACHQLGQWLKQGMTDIQVSVNLSARQFRQNDLAKMIDSVISRENITPDLLELEITESVAMDNPRGTVETMRIFRSIGVKLAIDDFGTGYSSLSYLKQFPMNCLKLDRSFVKDIETDPSDAAICAATISLAHNLGLEVVAEGVETKKQYEYLKLLGCDMIQGYYFCKPLPVAEVEAYILSRNAGAIPDDAPVLPANILVIDDDEGARELIKNTLEYLGHKPATVPNTVEGLEMVRKNPGLFGLVMVNMMMPDLSGVDLVKALCEANRDVPIVVMTSNKPDAVRKTLRPLERDHRLLYGINYFILEKPLTIEGIRELTHKILV